MDIPLAAIAGVWEGYTPCCDYIGDTVPMGAFAPYLR